MDFTQLAGNYLANRMNRAVAPYEDPMAYLENRVDANVAPVQTDTINPAETATQDFVPGGELAIERPGVPISQYLAQARQMSLAGQQNPNVNAPVQPEPELPPQAFPDPNAQAITSNYAPAGQNQGGYAASQQMPAAGTRVDQTQPVQQTTEQAITSNYAPAGQNQGGYAASVPAPSVPSLDSEAAAMSAAPGVYEEMQRRNAYNMNFSQGQNDLKTVSSIAFDDSAPGAVKFAANDKLRTAVNNLADIKTKTAEVDAALGDPSGKGAMKMLNAIAREREDGSLLKAIFYQRMGLNDLAKAEQMKLGAMDTYQPVALGDGRQGYVKVNYQGAPVAGWTDTGAMTADELINAQVGTKGSDVGKQAYKNRQGGELFFLRTTQNGRAQFVNTKGQVYTGDTSQLYPYGIGSDLETKNQAQRNELQNKLAYAPATKRAEYVAEWEAKYGKMSDTARQAALSGQPLPEIVGAVPTGQEQTTQAAPPPATETGTVKTDTSAVVNAPVVPDTSGKTPTASKASDTMKIDPADQKVRDQGRLATLGKERTDLERDLAAEKNPASRKEIQKLLDGNAREIAATQKNIGVLDKQIGSQQDRTTQNVPTSGVGFTARSFKASPIGPNEMPGAYQDRIAREKAAHDKNEEARYLAFQENLKREQSILEKKQSLPVDQEGKDRTVFSEKDAPAIRTAGNDGTIVADARRQQIKIIRDTPSIVGLIYGAGTPYDIARRYLVRSINGIYEGKEGAAEREKDLIAIGKNPQILDALQQFESKQADVNTKTIRETAPVGAISEAEQRLNIKNNMGNITESHPMAVANKLNSSLFASNLSIAKSKYLNDGYSAGQFSTTTGFEKAWKPIEAKLLKEYEGIYDARMKMVKPYDEALRKDPTNPKLIEDRKRAIIYSMEVYPAPEYNSSTNAWSYGSDAARKAAKKASIDNVLKGK
jgi:hypothetical protein